MSHKFSEMALPKQIPPALSSSISCVSKGRGGFLLVELLVSVAILSGTMLLILRFQADMMRIQRESHKRLRAVDSAVSFLEAQEGNEIYSGKSINKDGFMLDLRCDKIKIAKSNLPIALKKGLEQGDDRFKKVTVTATFGSNLLKKSSFKIATGVIANASG